VIPNDSLSGLASIIIPRCDPLEVTRRCITTLRRHTWQPWELIVVDDGSSDETSSYLESVRDAAAVPVTVIADGESRGLPAAINQGLRAARGEYLVVLNNDVVVTDGWLGQLIALANARGDFTAEHAETETEGEGEGRPAVDLGAGQEPPSARSSAQRRDRDGNGEPYGDTDVTRGSVTSSRGPSRPVQQNLEQKLTKETKGKNRAGLKRRPSPWPPRIEAARLITASVFFVSFCSNENTKRKTPLGITIRFATSLPELECMKTAAAQVSTEPNP
jgi:glycosyltransferase involved in cell wall biosynthesis